ncbi:hypothetical protein WE348_07860 [Alteromonas macleodii]|uniref:hypothetical protein n=1 Tax=Alteromonas macleodii TaxID=28108 RepID=UPI0030CFE8FA
MKSIFLKAICAFCFLSVSVNANAGLLSVNGSEVNALDINKSLVSFYNFSKSNYSANTGFELANQLVVFFANDNAGQLGLYLIFGGPGSVKGNVNFDITLSDGEIVFVDDPNVALRNDVITTTSSGYNVDMTWGANRTDGLILSSFSSDFWFINLDFNALTGINSFSFLTFDANGVESVQVFEKGFNSLSITSLPTGNVSTVSAPSSILLLSLALVGIGAFRRTKR